ncbi:DUF4062 domain-containing protein [Pectobacterium sp. 1950-15]|uniref:DUF4062 domain-containing protein n=1 Tax=Pectobacterium sp. 1950-15 TaxID=3128982 RepID=UPI003015D462
MNKRYQVFVSSTYKDLVEERQRITQTLMEMDCIPAGMEHFPAIDQEQFDFIKKVIDDSDYYIILVAGKYGSISPDTELSYTEMEYDYAVSKGIKVIALVHKDINSLTKAKTESKTDIADKLEEFRNKVCNGRLVKFWNSKDEIPGLVSVSLNKTITTFPAIGWVRANTIASNEVLSELNELRKENETLKIKISKENNIKESFQKTFDILKANKLSIPVKEKEDQEWRDCKKYNSDLYTIFTWLSPFMISEYSEKETRILIAMYLSKNQSIIDIAHPISLNQFNEIMADISALELIEPSKKKHAIKDKEKYLSLSKYGKEFTTYIRRKKLENNVKEK